MKLVNKKDFIEAVLNHKTGIVMSTGDADGDRNSPLEVNSIFFDSVNALSKNSSILAFDNKLDTSVVNGKYTSSIYSLGNAFIDTNAIASIREYEGDYLTDTFAIGVQRVFEIEIQGESELNTNSLHCIGLL